MRAKLQDVNIKTYLFTKKTKFRHVDSKVRWSLVKI